MAVRKMNLDDRRVWTISIALRNNELMALQEFLPAGPLAPQLREIMMRRIENIMLPGCPFALVDKRSPYEGTPRQVNIMLTKSEYDKFMQFMATKSRDHFNISDCARALIFDWSKPREERW